MQFFCTAAHSNCIVEGTNNTIIYTIPTRSQLSEVYPELNQQSNLHSTRSGPPSYAVGGGGVGGKQKAQILYFK